MQDSHSKRPPRRLSRTPVATAVLLALGSPAVLAQQPTMIEEVVVTAQKRTENLQDVPISIQALNTKTLEELHVQNFADYVQMLPSVTMDRDGTSGSGFSLVYMRGIATGGDGQATTSQPSVGMYLDEQPITTVQGNLDVHLYDIARVEALAGPQGTLYGASSQAGTIRIITNKPDPSGFAAGYSLEGNIVDGDDTGYMAEGFVNLPIGDKAAVRLVGWSSSTAGWIDNVEASRTFSHGTADDPDDDFTISNTDHVKDNYNTVDTVGGRAALRIELNDNWTVTPGVMTQKAESEGYWGDDVSSCARGCPFAAGDDNVVHFNDEFTKDEWYQAGLTIEGKIGNFDVVYSGNYLNRDFDGSFDYTDYSYWYDDYYTTYAWSDYFKDNDGELVTTGSNFSQDNHYTKKSHELRFSSPQENRVRGLIGFFWQEQFHDFTEQFQKAGIADTLDSNQDEPNGPQYPDTIYLNRAYRTDNDKAVFGQLSFDITDDLELTLGARFFKPETKIAGFFGYSLGFSRPCAPGFDTEYDDEGVVTCTLDPDSNEPGAVANGGEGAYDPDGLWLGSSGEWRCPSQATYKDAPCKNYDKAISESDHIGRVNLSWKATDDALVYATWSEGYRPGGINRNATTSGYLSDFLTNWEIGWKSEWLDNRLQFNGAVFLQEWDDIQLSFAGENGITKVANGPKAGVYGTEMQLLWLATDKLRLSAALAYYNSELKGAFLASDAEDDDAPEVSAPKGTSLPLTPDFKGNIVARYEFALGDFDAHWQGAFTYTGSSSSQLDLTENDIVGEIPWSARVDLSAGIQKDSYSVELFVQNVTNEDDVLGKTSNCDTNKCGYQSYGLRQQPRTIGISFSQKF